MTERRFDAIEEIKKGCKEGFLNKTAVFDSS